MNKLWTLLTLIFAGLLGYFLRGKSIVTESLNKNKELEKQSSELEKKAAVVKADIDKMKPPTAADLSADAAENFWNKNK